MTGRLIQMSGIVIDIVYRVEAVPLAGQEAEVRSAGLSVGGGFNAMVAARRAGVEVSFGGTLGTGPLAAMASAALVARGIPHIGGYRSDMDQGSCTVLVDDTGERTFIGLPGADGIVTDADLAKVWPGPQDWILQSGYALSYTNSCAALLRWHKGHQRRMVFDPGPRVAAIPRAALRQVLDATLWISANAAEAAVLTDLDDPEQSVRALAMQRPKTGGAVVRMGAAGAWLAQPQKTPSFVPAHPVTAIDTNGAGDTHIGFFVAMLAQGLPATEALRGANIAAALSTTLAGPSTAPNRLRVQNLLSRASQTINQQGTFQ